jgi:hypothetical protein
MEKAMNNTSHKSTSAVSTFESESLLSNILARLGAALVEENHALESGAGHDHNGFIMSKNQLLRELMAMQTTVSAKSLAPDLLELMRATRKLVDRNHQLLKLQVTALNDVTTYLTQAAVSEQGDGTYTREHQ